MKNKKPFKDISLSNDSIIRRFDLSNISESDIVWHKDSENRVVMPLNENDWKLQFDNEIPRNLVKGKKYLIPEGQFHRLIMGEKTNLSIYIEKYKDIKNIKENKLIKPKNLLTESKDVRQKHILELFNFHIENDIKLNESFLRIGSDYWVDLIKFSKKLMENNKISCQNEDELFLMENVSGDSVLYNNEAFYLDVPYHVEGDNFFVLTLNENKKVTKVDFKVEY